MGPRGSVFCFRERRPDEPLKDMGFGIQLWPFTGCVALGRSTPKLPPSAVEDLVCQLGHLHIGGKSDLVHSNTVMSLEVEFVETSLCVNVDEWT